MSKTEHKTFLGIHFSSNNSWHTWRSGNGPKSRPSDQPCHWRTEIPGQISWEGWPGEGRQHYALWLHAQACVQKAEFFSHMDDSQDSSQDTGGSSLPTGRANLLRERMQRTFHTWSFHTQANSYHIVSLLSWSKALCAMKSYWSRYLLFLLALSPPFETRAVSIQTERLRQKEEQDLDD